MDHHLLDPDRIPVAECFHCAVPIYRVDAASAATLNARHGDPVAVPGNWAATTGNGVGCPATVGGKHAIGESDSRWCYTIVETERDENGYIPCVVIEGQPGYRSLRGNGPQSRPWYWGTTREDAKRRCEEANTQLLGLTPEEAREIALSSFRAARRT